MSNPEDGEKKKKLYPDITIEVDRSYELKEKDEIIQQQAEEIGQLTSTLELAAEKQLNAAIKRYEIDPRGKTSEELVQAVKEAEEASHGRAPKGGSTAMLTQEQITGQAPKSGSIDGDVSQKEYENLDDMFHDLTVQAHSHDPIKSAEATALLNQLTKKMAQAQSKTNREKLDFEIDPQKLHSDRRKRQNEKFQSKPKKESE